jgi:hypothetical protein
MVGRGLAFAIPALFIVALTIILGGPSLIVAWAQLIMGRGPSAQIKAPLSLRIFTTGVLLQLAVLPTSWAVPDDRREMVITAFLVAGFVLVVTSAVMVGNSRWPGRSAVRFGSITLLVANVLGFGAILLGLPGMPLH